MTADSRTLLPDRDVFYNDVNPLLKEASAKGWSLVLLVIDVEGLDFILRTFGPGERDLTVKELGRRLREAAGGSNTPYHITQGRFAVVVARTTYRQAQDMAEALVDAFREPVAVAGVSYRLNAHVGMSQYPNHAASVSELVRTSVFACHQARIQDNNYATFDAELDDRERHQFRLMVDLERVLEKHEDIGLLYQPQVDLKSGGCVGVEGLCRWEHAELGTIPLADFLPYVEQTSLMMPLTEAILSEGLVDLAYWQAQGFEGTLAINLSPTLFRQPDLLERLFEQIRFANVDPSCIHLEVTETGIMEHPGQAIRTLGALRDGGVGIAVDDFGTGHSSLAYLADLPIDIIKIDQHFVQNLSRHWGDAIVGATAMLAGKLGVQTVAEGIEEKSQYEKCRELGVTFGQGYYTGRPMSRDAFQAWWQTSARSTGQL